MTLRAVFAAIEAGRAVVAREELARELSAAEVAALGGLRVLRDAPALTVWPCDVPSRRCGREVLGGAEAAPFVAVCEGSCDGEDRCEDVPLDADRLARWSLDAAALVTSLRAVYRVAGPPVSVAPSAATAADPLRLGEERAEARTRDVFLALSPARGDLAAFLEARERAPRPALVLVPKARAVASERASRHGPGAHVELELLEDAIAVRDGKLARVARPRLVVPAPAPSSLAEPVVADYAVAGNADDDAHVGSAKRGGIAAQLGAKRFEDVGIRVIDGLTVRITHQRKYVNASHIDLGLATKKTRNPTSEWKLLLDVCAGHGGFRWKSYGSKENAKQRVSVLQRRLREAFGLADNPFKKFTVVEGWRARFFARSDIAGPGD